MFSGQRQKETDSDEYQKHSVFSELEQYKDFYESLAWSVFRFLTTGVSTIFNIDSYLYSSIQGTHESICLVLKNGRINDAYALLRKYFDSAIIDVYATLYLEDHVSIENFVVEKIDNWVKGKEKFPDIRAMQGYIHKSEKVAPIVKLLYSDDSTDTYRKIRNRCNDHTHYNLYYHVLLNDNDIYLEHRIKSLNIFANDLRNVFILHLSYLFFLKYQYMSLLRKVGELKKC